MAIETVGTVAALLTAKGNNTLKDKNLLPVCGKPLLYYPARAAAGSRHVRDYFVSSDCERILKTAEGYGYRPIRRPDALAQPASQHRDAIEHALGEMRRRGVEPEILVVLLGNNAIVKSEWIDDCIAMLQRDATVSAVVPVVCEMDRHPYRAKRMTADGRLEAFFDFEGQPVSSNRQDLPRCYFLCHNFWVLRVERALAQQGEPPWTFLGDRVLPFEVPMSLDVHKLEDLAATEEWVRANYPPEIPLVATRFRGMEEGAEREAVPSER
jgi:N-acylneuraminate cytidylyltransferase